MDDIYIYIYISLSERFLRQPLTYMSALPLCRYRKKVRLLSLVVSNLLLMKVLTNHFLPFFVANLPTSAMMARASGEDRIQHLPTANTTPATPNPTRQPVLDELLLGRIQATRSRAARKRRHIAACGKYDGVIVVEIFTGVGAGLPAHMHVHLRQALKRRGVEEQTLETLSLASSQVVDLVGGVWVVVVRAPRRQLRLQQPHHEATLLFCQIQLSQHLLAIPGVWKEARV